MFLFVFQGKEALCIMPVKNIQAVEKLDESAFNRKNVSRTWDPLSLSQ
jgi:hypothetical protein